MNNGGSVLCSNSSFSSLLSSPNTDTNEPSFITTPGDTPPFVDGDAYSYTSTDGDSSSSISFSHCHFTSPNYASNVRPLTFDDYPGSIALLSCSFTGAARPDDHPDYDPDCPEESGGGAFISSASTPHTTHVKVESCNFTDCSAPKCGGGLFISTTAIVTVTGCRCVGCSVTKNENRVAGGGMFIKLSSTPGSTVSDLSFEWCTSSSYAGGLSVEDVESTHHITTLSFKECSVSSATYLVATSHLKFEDCSASENGGGLAFVSSRGPLSLTDCEFLRCRVTNPDSHFSRGGGLSADSSESTLTVKNCKFIDCSSTTLGAAMIGVAGRFELSDCLVRNCSSKTSGAVCIIPYYGCHSPIALKNVLFVGNTVSDTPTYFDDEEAMKDAVQFADFLIEDEFNESPTEVTISDCWTTTTPNTAGMYSSEYDPETLFLTYTRVELTAFHEVGPYLTQKVEAVVDVESWTVEVIVKGRVPLESQIYEMTVTEEEGGAKMTGQVRFRDGIGSLLPSSSLNLQFSTTYTITSIVGLVPSSSSTTTANGITLTAEAWAFNLNSNPAFVSFTTPDAPAETSIVVVAGGGSDSIDECGGEDLPCRTVWTGQMVGKGKGGEWIRMLVRGEAEMGEGFWIGGNVRMTLSSESATQRSRIVIGRSSLSSMDGIVSISSSTVEVSDLKVIVPSSEEHPSSGWVFVVDSEGTLEASSIGVSGNGEIGIGLAKVKSGSSRFASISISSGSSFGVGVVMGEGKWSTISMLICDFVVRDTTTSNSPLICFSSLSPDSTFSMEGSRFQKTHRLVGSSSSSSPDGNGDSLIEVSTAQPTTEIFKCVFEWSGVADRSGTITRSALRVTLNSSSSSSCSLVISSCLFLDSHPSSSLSGSLHIRVVSGHTTIVFRESWFEETTPTHPWTQNETRIACLDWTRKRVETLSTSVNGALIEYSNEIPIVVRRRGMFSNCKLIMSQKS
ncbi:hypothetical protein BLNAU_6032 [Blattamonas nauphoetae]|uniref:Right handed beta helix domain-containing protein n=1 Tax=Blattamonas nauphoetae TaxID=2049346 RepID=A0ABQ9Y5K3_9EUKA|nr:hypothetical protein BLNAU_6032 [Blattamonas nauphoetae]